MLRDCPLNGPRTSPPTLNKQASNKITSTSYPFPPELYAPFMQTHLAAAEEVCFRMMSDDGPDVQGKLLAEVLKEILTGVTMTESPIVVAGRKAE